MTSSVDVTQFTIEKLIDIQSVLEVMSSGGKLTENNAELLKKVENEIKRRNGRKWGVQHEL